jgi:hypothetical protein
VARISGASEEAWDAALDASKAAVKRLCAGAGTPSAALALLTQSNGNLRSAFTRLGAR